MVKNKTNFLCPPPHELILPEKPTQEQLLLFLCKVVLALDQLSPKELKKLLDFLEAKTAHLKES